MERKEAERIKKAGSRTIKKTSRHGFPPGALTSFLPLLAETVAEVTTGGSGAEARYQASVELDFIPLEKAVALCRRHGIGASEISHALVDIATLGARAFPNGLNQPSAEAIESIFRKKVAGLLKPPKARR